MTKRFAALLLVASLAACVSGRDCVTAIPADIRADVMRYVVEKRLCPPNLMPREDYDLAVGAGGRPLASLDDDRRRRVTLYANGYANCVKERIDR